MKANVRHWGIAARTIETVPAVMAIELVAQAGFDHVGVLVNPDTWTSAETRLVRGRQRDTGVRVLDVEVIRLTGVQDASNSVRILDIAAEIHARYVLVVGQDTDRARTVEAFASLCAMAAERGLRAALEFMPFRAVATLRDALEVVRAANHPAGCILADNHHLARSRGSTADIAGLPASVLGYAQICDVDADNLGEELTADALMQEALHNRLPPGTGRLPCHAFVEALPEATPVSIEILGPHQRALFPDDRAYLAALRRSVERLC